MAADRGSKTKRCAVSTRPHSTGPGAEEHRCPSARPYPRATKRTARRSAFFESRLRDAAKSRRGGERSEFGNNCGRKAQLADSQTALIGSAFVALHRSTGVSPVLQ